MRAISEFDRGIDTQIDCLCEVKRVGVLAGDVVDDVVERLAVAGVNEGDEKCLNDQSEGRSVCILIEHTRGDPCAKARVEQNSDDHSSAAACSALARSSTFSS
jgi:hypothetical protein